MSEVFLDLLREFLVAFAMLLIVFVLPILVGNLVIFVNSLVNNLKAKLTGQQVQVLDLGARMVISALEQESVKGALNATKQELKTLAITRLATFLKDYGFKNISADTLGVAIENALYQGYHKGSGEVQPTLPTTVSPVG